MTDPSDKTTIPMFDLHTLNLKDVESAVDTEEATTTTSTSTEELTHTMEEPDVADEPAKPMALAKLWIENNVPLALISQYATVMGATDGERMSLHKAKEALRELLSTACTRQLSKTWEFVSNELRKLNADDVARFDPATPPPPPEKNRGKRDGRNTHAGVIGSDEETSDAGSVNLADYSQEKVALRLRELHTKLNLTTLMLPYPYRPVTAAEQEETLKRADKSENEPVPA